MTNWFFKLQFKIFFWLGKRMFGDFQVWQQGKAIKNQRFVPNGLNVDVITFSNVRNWQRSTKRSKKYFGIPTRKGVNIRPPAQLPIV